MTVEETSPQELEATKSVEETTASPEEVAEPKKKPATKRRKSTTAKSKRRKTAAKTLAPEPAPAPLTLEELKQQGREAKQELVNAVVEPAVEAVGSLSQTVRDTISGAFAGLLSRKRRR
jgi:hypothetical protein